MDHGSHADPMLSALIDELGECLASLNDLHHPVYAGDPRLIRERERHLGELRSALGVRRRELAGR